MTAHRAPFARHEKMENTRIHTWPSTHTHPRTHAESEKHWTVENATQEQSTGADKDTPPHYHTITDALDIHQTTAPPHDTPSRLTSPSPQNTPPRGIPTTQREVHVHVHMHTRAHVPRSYPSCGRCLVLRFFGRWIRGGLMRMNSSMCLSRTLQGL